MRIVPCAPLGVATTQDPEELCWPMVRLVWQPILIDYRQNWGATVAEYADDRAIHALYPLQARDNNGNVIESRSKELIKEHLGNLGLASSIPEDVFVEFAQQRDDTAAWLLQESLNLRSRLPVGSWSDSQSAQNGSRKIHRFFKTVCVEISFSNCTSGHVGELTSFSLPEGREPAHIDIWVFLARKEEKAIYILSIFVFRDREDGKELINMGASQTVGMITEDPVVEESIAQGNAALAEHVVTQATDEAIDRISDPNKVFWYPIHLVLLATSSMIFASICTISLLLRTVRSRFLLA